MDNELDALLAPYLARHERVLWTGRPTIRRFLQGVLVLMVFAVPWTAFAFFWEAGVLGAFGNGPRGGAGLFMSLFGLPFIAIGLAMLSAPVFQVLAARALRYAVTDRRAFIVRVGRKPEVRDYTPKDFLDLSDLARLTNRPGDLFFAIDRDANRLTPGDATPRKGGPFAPVGFVGLTDVDRVQPYLDDLRRKAPRAAATRRSDDAEAVLETKGSYAAFRTKLGAWLEARAELGRGRTRKHMARVQVGGAIAVVLGAGFSWAAIRADAWPFVFFIALVLAIGIAVAVFAVRKGAQLRDGELARGQALHDLLGALAEDAHPRTPVQGFLDMAEAVRVRPARAKTSFSSGALKTWHRHHWARLTWGLVDGSLICLNILDRVKLKSGLEVARTHHVRGRIAVNGTLYDTDRLGGGFRTPLLEVRAWRVGDQAWLGFRGELAEVGLLRGELVAIYRKLATCARPRAIAEPLNEFQ